MNTKGDAMTATATEYSAARVCVDCYYAHHYGTDAVENPDPRWSADKFSVATANGYWADWHCSEHDWDADECGQCGTDNDGHDTFSWSRCDTCGTTAGGERYRLAYDGN
jgi:hypothetical protein